MTKHILTDAELYHLAKTFASQYGKEPKHTTNGYDTHCPLHDDQHGSLSISEKNGKILVHCQAGCDQEKVWDSIKAVLPNTPKPERGSSRTIDKIYSYHDVDGRLVFEKIRYKPKAFSVRRPDGNGGYIYDLKGIDTTIIYRLPEVYEAIKASNTICLHKDQTDHLSDRGFRLVSEPIYIPEGEKDCESLAASGLLATCNIFGASQDGKKPKWTDGHTVWLKNAQNVVILPDNDLPGKAHAQAIAKSLYEHKIPCKIVELTGLPDKGDVSDWFANGGTKEQLLELTAKAPYWYVEESTTLEEWPDPVLFDRIDTPNISSAFLPDWLAKYTEALSLSTQVPSALPVMQVLAVVATALQNKFEVCPYGDNYTEPLCVWTIVILPPASRKTAIVTALTIPLIKYETDEAKRLKPIIAKHNAEQKVLKKRVANLEKKASESDDLQERKLLIDEMAKLEQQLEEQLLSPRLFTGDVTPERLQNLMAEHNGKMAVLSDEGGIFEVMSGLYTDGKANIDVFLKAHANSAIRVDRGNRTVIIDHPALSFGITVQPQIISEFSQGSKRRFRGIGACARFLWCVPRSNIGKRDVRKRVPIPDDVVGAYEKGIFNLLKIDSAMDENGSEKQWKLLLDDEARDSWLKFSQYIESRQGEGGDLESIQDWSGKLPGAALRIAGLLHVSKHGCTGTEKTNDYLVIGKEAIERALDLCELLIEHAKTAFGTIGADPAIEDAKIAFNWIVKEKRDSFKQSELHRTGRFSKSPVGRLLKALEILRTLDIIDEPRTEPTRKPTIVYDVNPKIYEALINGMA